ncbi:ABC transporter ATP-binding protein [Segetibacter sp. 3557_3]|uniref:ABC transporter ATP-binding protein n=1 Tax=Segetibacter sp. 3557_3 TaxID=2547429 RepID=UPI001058A8B4|nr:ATP-binding cassette domain-containing protein [Segetibacter sp. 3557_3]TDH21614.1 ABC transporter ATP-binding protein [Segetibacter sp. 3557_3]
MIKIKNLHFAYKKRKIFNGLSLSLKAGHIYGLLGKNGTGKSTLLRCIIGLLFPDEGTIEVMGMTPGKRHPDFLHNVFIVAEEFYLPDVSVERFVKLNAPFYPNFSQEQFMQYLDEFEIPQENTLQNMSYGQKKKVLISFGLACNTALLLMDEPTNGLDIMSKSKFRKVIAGAVDENKCIVISTHQVKDLESLIDRITIIDEGKILFDQTIDSINRQIQFKISFDQQEIAESLYKEPSLQGLAIVTANTEVEDTRLDLELLYKAVVTNGDAVRAVFNHQYAGQ